VAPTVSQARLWRNSGTVDFLPLTGLQLRLDLASQRDLRDYGDSTTLGRLAGLERKQLLGVDVGLESQRSLSSLVAFSLPGRGWLRPRATLGSGFTLSRDPNARDPVREIGDTAGGFRIPTNFSNNRRLDLGTQLDAGRLARALFGDSAGLAKTLARLTTADVSVARTLSSTFSRVGFTPSLAYQLALGGFDDFRRQGARLAGSASDNVAVAANGAALLPLGFRVTTAFRRSAGTAWILRTDQQVPIETESREWPTGSIGWTLSPSRLLTSLSAQLGFRELLTRSVQPGVVEGSAGTVNQNHARSVSPAVTLTWAGGILTSADATLERADQTSAGNLFRSERAQYNVNLGFAVRVPTGLARLPMPIRANARFSRSRNTTCLRTAGQEDCLPFIDSRQTTGNITFDTDFPPNVSAGLQMAYVLNEERQASRRVRQIVVTAFVNLATTVGRLQ
jgi:hypothetical protein